MAQSSFLGIVDTERELKGRVLDINNISVLLLNYIHTFSELFLAKHMFLPTMKDSSGRRALEILLSFAQELLKKRRNLVFFWTFTGHGHFNL